MTDTGGAPAGWAALIDAMLHAVWLVDGPTLRILVANQAAADLLGLRRDELAGKAVIELAATPEDLCFWGEVADGTADGLESETFARHCSGRTVPVLRRVSRVDAGGDRPVYVVALHDRSAQVRVENDFESAMAELSATLESTADGILVTDLAGRIRNCNRRFGDLWGLPQDLLLHRDDDAILEWMRRSVTEPAAYMRRLSTFDDATMMQASDVLTLHSGKVLERVTLPQCSRGRPIGRVFSFRDITEKVAAGERIDMLSHTDGLTGLPNRRRLADRVELALALAQRDGTPFALLMVDLDRFKHINETLGHGFGDRVLQDVAERLTDCLRQIDTVARLGGDEFVLLVQQAGAGGAEATARRVMDAMQRPFTQGGMSFTVTASIGIALCPNDGADLDELLRHSDAAMHEVKRAGRCGYRFHLPRAGQGDHQARSRMRIDHAMRQALAQQRFRLHYQPQVDLRSGEVLGAEALIRWHDPELGDVSPGEFIPVAEESGFIVAIGDWVLREAVHQGAAWHARGLALGVAVNVSALQFRQPGFVEGVAAVLHDAGLPAEALELELTESILIQDLEDTLMRLNALAQLGVKMAIDDFGTGYSSLGYLKRLPIHRLKIDRSFIAGLPGDASDAGIVHAIVNMGRALKLEVIAEGVETEGQRQFLRQAGCDQFQGFLHAPALAPQAFEALLTQTEGPRASIRRVK